MHFHFPEGSQEIQIKQINDLSGVRHIALTVSDAQEVFDFIEDQKKKWSKQGLNLHVVGENHQPETVVPYPYKYFYWTDPWGVQWEMEEGRPVDRVIKGKTG
jgi:purine nucleosidase